MIIHQPHFHTLFVEILKLSEQRNVPDWLFDNIERGILLSRYKYEEYNERQEWNEIFFINDRYRDRSFIGGIAEIAWVMSHTDTELMFTLPCLTKEEQVTQGLDFYIGENAYQLKTVELGSYGDLQVRYEYLDTTADYLVLIDPLTAKSYTISPTKWRALKATSYNDVGRNMFWVEKYAIETAGGEIRDLPEFVKRAKPPKEIK